MRNKPSKVKKGKGKDVMIAHANTPLSVNPVPVADPVRPEDVTAKAISYANECGMSNGVRVVSLVKTYFGFVAVLSDAKGRSANLNFDKDGNPQMWEMH